MKPQKLIRVVFAIVLIPLGLYLLAALVLARVPANTDWREPESGITIYVQSNAFHTGIVLPEPGYTPYDRFYPARGRYSALVTCNVWTGGALKAAGVRTGIWTPFAGDVMRWVPWPPISLPAGPA